MEDKSSLLYMLLHTHSVCMYMYSMYVHVCVCGYADMWRPEVSVRCLPQLLSTLFVCLFRDRASGRWLRTAGR